MQFDNVVVDGKSVWSWTDSLTPGSTGSATTAEQAFTVSSPVPLKTTDMIFVSPPASGNAVGVGAARASSATQVSVRFVNPTAGGLTHAAGVFGFLAIRP